MSDLTSLKVTQLLQIILTVKISNTMIKELFNIERWEYTRTIVFELFVRAFENGTDIYFKNRLVFKWHFNKTLCSSNKEIWMLQWFQVRRGIAISDIVLCVKCEWEPCLASIRWTDLYIQYGCYRYYVSATLAILLYSNRNFLMRRTSL